MIYHVLYFIFLSTISQQDQHVSDYPSSSSGLSHELVPNRDKSLKKYISSALLNLLPTLPTMQCTTGVFHQRLMFVVPLVANVGLK